MSALMSGVGGINQPEVEAIREQLTAAGLSNDNNVQTCLKAFAHAMLGEDDAAIRFWRGKINEAIEQAEAQPTASVDATTVTGLPPDLISQTEIRAAVQGHAEARQRATDAGRDLVHLKQTRPQAGQRDAEAFADALAAGKSDPARSTPRSTS